MSVSEISILKCIGGVSKSLYSSLRDLEQKSAGSALAAEEIRTKRMSRKIDTKAEEILAKYGERSLVYATRYIDNNTVGGSTIANLREVFFSLNCFKDGLLETERFRIWFMMPEDDFDINILRRVGGLKVIKSQVSERMMFFNIKEACHAWETLQVPSLIFVIEKILGPTWSDEQVLESCQVP